MQTMVDNSSHFNKVFFSDNSNVESKNNNSTNSNNSNVDPNNSNNEHHTSNTTNNAYNIFLNNNDHKIIMERLNQNILAFTKEPGKKPLYLLQNNLNKKILLLESH